MIRRAEDRELFRDAVHSCGLRAEVEDRHRLGPARRDSLRRSFGPRSRSAVTAAASRNEDELRRQVETGLRESPVDQVLVEESIRGWDEFELEVMRDRRTTS